MENILTESNEDIFEGFVDLLMGRIHHTIDGQERFFDETPLNYYYQKVMEIIENFTASEVPERIGRYLSINVNFQHLADINSRLTLQLSSRPRKTLDKLNEKFKGVMLELGGERAFRGISDYYVRVFNPMMDKVKIGELGSARLERMIKIEGMVTKASQRKPLLKKGVYECSACGETFEHDQERLGQYVSPKTVLGRCPNTNCRSRQLQNVKIIARQSKLIDWQRILVQEPPEDLEAGGVPRAIECIFTGDYVGLITPGVRVEITGILYYKPDFNPGRDSDRDATFDRFVDVVYVKEMMNEDIGEITERDLRKIQELKEQNGDGEIDLQGLIINSIAPHIYGEEMVKHGFGLMMFGGVEHINDKTGKKERGDIYIMLAGDPGTGKSIIGKENVYILSDDGWKCREIGTFVDDLISRYNGKIIKYGDTEVLKMNGIEDYFTMSINPKTLKTQKTKLMEISRHKTNRLMKIRTRSGRSVTATLDHSFSTMVNGELKPILGKKLKKGMYLPIARRIDIGDELRTVNLTEYIQDTLVDSDKIKELIKKATNNEISFRKASKKGNITPNTILNYKNDIERLPEDGGYVRNKYDGKWFPKEVQLDGMFGKIVGFYLSEGSIKHPHISLTNTNKQVKKEMIDAVNSVFGKPCVSGKEILISQASVTRWFKKKFGKGAGNKKIPHKFMFSPIEFRKNLLSAYFTGDGYVDSKGKSVMGTTKSKKLAYSISDLLATMGIFAIIKPKIIRSGKYKGNVYYRIRISGEEAIHYHQKIGFLVNYKQEDLEKVVNEMINGGKRYQTYDIIPNFGSILTDIKDELGLVGNRDTPMRSFLAELRGKTNRQKAGRLYLQDKHKRFKEIYDQSGLQPNGSMKKLKTLITSDVLWDRIEEIQIIEKESLVYDLGTSDHHFILVNGNLIVHNSEFLKYTKELMPKRYAYVSGKEVSLAGLTAGIVKDKQEIMSLEAGATVLASDGVIAIDEFDKMHKRPMDGLLQVMVNQEVAIHKAGIHATLPAKCAIIAGMNPVDIRYNYNKDFATNMNLDETITSRFDIIFLMVDNPNPDWDKEYVMKMYDMFDEEGSENRLTEVNNDFEVLPKDFLVKYIRWARENIHPKLTREAKEVGTNLFLAMRTEGGDSSFSTEGFYADRRTPNTARRLAEANARMNLREEVTAEDMRTAYQLYQYSLEQVAKDEFGDIDLDAMRGMGNKKRNLIPQIKDLIKELEDDADTTEEYSKLTGVPFRFILDKVMAEGVIRGDDEEEIAQKLDGMLQTMVNKEILIQPRDGGMGEVTYKVITRKRVLRR